MTQRRLGAVLYLGGLMVLAGFELRHPDQADGSAALVVLLAALANLTAGWWILDGRHA